MNRKLSTFAGMVSLVAATITTNAAADDLFGALWTKGISGTGHAVINGVLDRQEWHQAATEDFLVNLPGGGAAPATL